MARITVAFAWFSTLLVTHEQGLILLLSALLLFAAVRAGWRQGGGPAWWVLALTSFIAIIAFGIKWIPKPHWEFASMIQGAGVAARLLGFIAIGVWTMARVNSAELVSSIQRLLTKVAPRRGSSWALSIAMAISSIGWMRLESDRYRAAVAARNSQITDGRLDRITRIQRLFSMVLVGAIRRSEALTVSLHCRGWRDGTLLTSDRQRWSRMEKAGVAFSWLTVILLAYWQRWL